MIVKVFAIAIWCSLFEVVVSLGITASGTPNPMHPDLAALYGAYGAVLALILRP